MLREHLLNDGERLRITSRAPVDVFLPELDSSTFIVDFDGNYWPFRAVKASTLIESDSQIAQTIDRTLQAHIVEDRPPGSNFTHELIDLAGRHGFDAVQPALYTGTSRDSVANSVMEYEAYDPKSNIGLHIPVSNPHGMVISCLRHQLTDPEEHGQSVSIADRHHPTDIVVSDLFSHSWSLDTITGVIDELWELGGYDINIHLRDVYPTVELAEYIRERPNVISTLTLSSDAILAVPENAKQTSTFSSVGEADLRQELRPSIHLAGAFSLLTSDYISDDGFAEVADECIVPSVPLTTDIVEGYYDVLNGDVPTAFDPSGLDNTKKTQSNLGWY